MMHINPQTTDAPAPPTEKPDTETLPTHPTEPLTVPPPMPLKPDPPIRPDEKPGSPGCG